MRRALRSGLLAVVVFSGITQAGVVSKHGALKIAGNNVVDAAGKPIQLAGMSLYWPLWGGEVFFNAGAIKTTVDWGASIVRVPIAVGNVKADGTPQSLYTGNVAPIIAAVDAAIANDIYVIIDWHVEQDAPQEANAITFFTDMAKKYGRNPHVIFEIWNEPRNSSWDVIKAYAKNVVGAIRDPSRGNSNNLVIIGSGDWSKNVTQAAASQFTDFPNIAYTFHFYACTHGQSYRNAVSAASAKIPIMFTEWGTTEASGGGSVCISETDAWLALAKEKKISWTNWSL